jgi:hypothetical protein
LQPLRRRRQLFVNDPLPGLLTEQTRSLLLQSVSDLQQIDERIELGLGVFIDRPLGYGKAIGEPDRTPLLAHEAFSPALARQRWRQLQELCGVSDWPSFFEHDPCPLGLPCAELADCPRPTAALADVRKVANDFVIVRTLPGVLGEFLSAFDWRPLLQKYRLRFLADRSVRLCVEVLRAGQPVLAIYDGQLRRRLEMVVDVSQGYAMRAGVEVPRAGLRVMTVAEDTDDPAVLVFGEGGEVVGAFLGAKPPSGADDA